MLNFEKHKEYKRQEIWNLVKGKGSKMSYAFQRSGYERIDENLFAFINIGFEGDAGHIFPNTFDEKTETLKWYGKKKTTSQQDLMRNIIDGFLTIYCFARRDENLPLWTFLGIGRVINYFEKQPVYDTHGTKTFCLAFELNCKDQNVNSSLINNFDSVYEEDSHVNEGQEKYVRHKTRERNREIIEKKKNEFIQAHGKLFCEVCNFDFEHSYGARGEKFIECHHNIPLHETHKTVTTKTSDLTLLCSNCHRMIHRKRNEWLSVEELKEIFK